jgi:hypothetical protein
MPAPIFMAWTASVLGTSAFGLIASRRPGAAVALTVAAQRPAEGPGSPPADPPGQCRAPRRAGDPPLVYVTDPSGAVIRGCVLSRSPVGLRLRVEWYIPKGTLILVQAADAPGLAAPAAATVWMCRPMDVLYEVGCQFTTRPPVSTLLTFG